ncbi:hypothetical protein BH10BAC3_BH10BAC3_27610 [soil metagenome]
MNAGHYSICPKSLGIQLKRETPAQKPYRVDTVLLIFLCSIQRRGFTELNDLRLIQRGNKILSDLFSNNVYSIRQLSSDEASAKGFYRFLQNDRISEDDILRTYQ